MKFGQPALQLPPSNAALQTLTLPGYNFSGTVYIRFIGTGRMVVDKPGSGTTGGVNRNPVTMDIPTNGVIYVSDAGCSSQTSPDDTDYTDGTGCGDVYVSGTADRPLTIGAARDIILAPTLSYTGTTGTSQFNPVTATGSDADLRQDGAVNSTTHAISGQTQLGLIANRYVRVYHRLDTNGNMASGVRSVRIDAAVLSLQNSFIVDNWNSGGYTGTLTVNGAIAQQFRGPVGISGSPQPAHGYAKDYWYDDRLKYASPPYFLDPVNSAWNVSRETELVPSAP
jgi:hypothetical protein